MTENFAPLLAADANKVQIKFPLLASPKLDGIRCIMVNGKAMSRSMKPIANHYTRKQLELHAHPDALHNVDGELMVGDVFNATTSGIMSYSGQPNFTYHVFDIHSLDADIGFSARFHKLYDRKLPEFCKVVPHNFIENQEQLDEYNVKMLESGMEGIMLRSINGWYKQGRSTAKEGILLKLKPFEDSEAIITGFEELKHNENEQFTSELGYSKRSSQQAGLVGGNTLGKFLVTGTQAEHFGGVEFKVGSGLGLTQALRQEVWDNREKYLGKLIKFKYQKIGSIDKPRIPIFLGFRDPSDMSPTPPTQSTNWNSGFGFCPNK